MSSLIQHCRFAAVPSLALLLAACAIGPSVESEPGAQNTRARYLLSQLVNQGPVPIVTAGEPASLDKSEAIDNFARGVSGLTVVFDPLKDDAASLDKQRVVLRWGGDGDLCTSMPTSPGLAFPFTAAFCDGRETVAAVTAEAPADSTDTEKRLMWRAANRLFPDDYDQSYGLGLGLGIFGGSSSGVGVGGGLSF